MTKTKSTKRALLMSALALVVCVSMLIGSTFAWFTDSVSSTNNIIKSGNLDVELEYLNGNSWEKVTATTNVFEENTLWEPGHTEVVYLRVSNLGTLALKYQLGINIVNEVESINVAGKTLRLSDYIEFVAIEDVDTAYETREDARKAAADAATDPVILSTGYTQAGNIEAGAAAQYVALVVYMPENIGNEANYRTGEVAPQIELGINLMATQYTSEEDSFDETYDANAKFDGIPAARTTTLAKMPVVTTINDNTYTLDTAYVFNTTETYDQAQLNAHRYWHADFVATFDQNVDDAAIGLAGAYNAYNNGEWLAFELDGFGDIVANTPVRMLDYAGISMNYEELCLIVKEFSCGAFAVNPEAMAGTTMTVELRLYETKGDPNTTTGPKNEETGEYITIGTYSYTFAPYIGNAEDLIADLTPDENGVIDLDKDYVVTSEWTSFDIPSDSPYAPIADEIVVNGNGHTISGLTKALLDGSVAGKVTINDLTIKDSTIASNNVLGTGAFIEYRDNTGGGSLTMTNCHAVNVTVNSDSYAGALVGHCSGSDAVTFTNCTVTNCTINGANSVGGIVGHIQSNGTFTNCTVTGTKLTSTDDGEWRVGAIIGTANGANTTKTLTNCTGSGNTLSQTGKMAPEHNLYGRRVDATLKIDGVEQ